MNRKKQVKFHISKVTGIIIVSILLLLYAFPQQSYATILLCGDGAWGDFKGSLTYNSTNASSATLDITLKNTSPMDNGGFLTAFVFNNPSNLINGITTSFTNTNFKLLGLGADGINGMPYGYFDIGSGLGGDFEGGGNPNLGIPVDDTENFVFYLSGTGLDTLSESSFINEMPVLPNGTLGNEFFVVRFKGFNNGQSNKTPGNIVPEPASLSLLGLGLLGLVGLRKKKIT